MNVHEYQGKEILSRYGVRIQRGIVAETPEQAVAAYQKIAEMTNSKFAVVKSQIHAGGRGKGSIVGIEQRGVQLAKSADDITRISTNLTHHQQLMKINPRVNRLH
jgi:succinyl-CoA synthetase beta subunit